MSRVPMGSDGGAWAMDPETAYETGFVPQGIGADLIATLEGFTRERVDTFAVESQTRAAKAWANGYFARSVVPVTDRNGIPVLERDEHIRAGATLESLAGLTPSFAMMGEAGGFDAVALQRYHWVEKIDRRALDEHAAESQRRAEIAIKEGRFDRSLVPVFNLDGTLALDHEEFPRPGTTADSLAALAPSFPAVADHRFAEGVPTFRELINQKYPDLKIEHVHHAGNSSGVVDGAGAVLYASGDYVKAHGLKPRARVVAAANMGDDPTLMLNAPVPAARKVLEKAGMTLDDIDLFEINEAFAVVSEKFMRDLELDRDKVNVNGGAMALGHPIGGTGAILIGTILDELERQDKQVGLVTMCAAGGMAPAIIIERV
jgi:acetyl-CoA acetyltransferase